MANFFTKISKNNTTQPKNKEEETINILTNEDTLLPNLNPTEPGNNLWLDKENTEGQLSVDVFQTKDSLIIKSTIAGVKPEDIDISIDNDVFTIRGTRKIEETVREEDYFYQECYWGSFSRSIVLPMEINPDEVEATLKNGVLTVVLPKVKKNKSIAVKVKTE